MGGGHTAHEAWEAAGRYWLGIETRFKNMRHTKKADGFAERIGHNKIFIIRLKSGVLTQCYFLVRVLSIWS